MVYRLFIPLMFILSVYSFANIFKDVDSFQANFEQHITNSSNTTIIYEGEIFIKGDKNILWKYKTPIIKDVYILHDIAIVDEPELEQAIYTKLDKELNLFKIIKEATKIDENSYKAVVNNIDFTILIQNNNLYEISYLDELENRVVINFDNILLNQEIKSSIFEFFPPANYDIIRK